MKHASVLLSPRAALLIGAALLSTPALAQDVTQPVAPPPVVTTAPPVTPPPAVVTAPAAPAAEAPAPRAAEPRRAVTRTERTTTTRATRAPVERAEPRQQAARPAAAPAPAPAEPVAQQPAAPVAQPVPVDPIAPAPVTEQPAAPVASQPANIPTFVWVLLGLVVLAGLAIAALATRRRSSTAYAAPVEPLVTTGPEPFVDRRPVQPRAEPVSREAFRPEPTIAVAPVAAAPDAAIPVDEPREPVHSETEAEIAQVRTEDLAIVSGASHPAGHRPWIEFGMRPVRAGTSDEEALVEFELTVGNSGDEPARDVRITTFMVPEGSETEMEQLLIDHANDASVPPVTIAAGEGTRVDAVVATPKGDDLPRTFNPLVIADARYRLPDGSEGRTAAAFRIGRHAPVGGLGGIGTSRPHIVEDVEAELEEVLERV